MTEGAGVPAVLECLRSGDVASAVRLAAGVNVDGLHQAVLGEAFDHQSLNCYGLYVGLLLEQETAERHVAASELLSLALNVIPGGYQMAYFHAVRAVALAPGDVSFKEHLLSFHNNPEDLLPHDDARRLARELLEFDPSNDAGREVLRAVGESD